jgi:hypothetical protein
MFHFQKISQCSESGDNKGLSWGQVRFPCAKHLALRLEQSSSVCLSYHYTCWWAMNPCRCPEGQFAGHHICPL